MGLDLGLCCGTWPQSCDARPRDASWRAGPTSIRRAVRATLERGQHPRRISDVRRSVQTEPWRAACRCGARRRCAARGGPSRSEPKPSRTLRLRSVRTAVCLCAPESLCSPPSRARGRDRQRMRPSAAAPGRGRRASAPACHDAASGPDPSARNSGRDRYPADDGDGHARRDRVRDVPRRRAPALDGLTCGSTDVSRRCRSPPRWTPLRRLPRTERPHATATRRR